MKTNKLPNEDNLTTSTNKNKSEVLGDNEF